MDEYTSVFMRMTISNIRQRSPLLWCGGRAWAGQGSLCRMHEPVAACNLRHGTAAGGGAGLRAHMRCELLRVDPSCACLPACLPACLRIHFTFVYLNVFWASWLIIEYYKARRGARSSRQPAPVQLACSMCVSLSLAQLACSMRVSLSLERSCNKESGEEFE